MLSCKIKILRKTFEGSTTYSDLSMSGPELASFKGFDGYVQDGSPRPTHLPVALLQRRGRSGNGPFFFNTMLRMISKNDTLASSDFL